MKRIKFKKGKQKKFLELILEKINCPSLRELINRGFDIPYSTLKNYFNRSEDLVARYGGEEFVVILPNMNSKNALNLANNLVKKIQGEKLPYEASPIGKGVTISIGVVTMHANELSNNSSIIDASDKALYKAKENGRNRAEQYS